MREAIVYLDSSGIVKRYVEEPGSKLVKDIFLRAYAKRRFWPSLAGTLVKFWEPLTNREC
ncbi:MAG: hypothetical protein QXU09_03965 [Thermoproteota archaeon]